MSMMETPRPNELYRKIAKDYNPKAAEMAICKYVQDLEQRVIALEKMLTEKPEETEEKTETAKKKGSKKNG